MTTLLKASLAALLAMCLTAGARDTFTREEWQALESERQIAETQLQTLREAGRETVETIDDIDAALIASALDTRRRESDAARAETALQDLEQRAAAARRSLYTDETALGDLMAALAATNRRRPPALIVSPGRANEAIRRAVLMRATQPVLEARAHDLRKEVAGLARIERDLKQEQTRLVAAETELAARKIEIETLAARKRAESQRIGTDVSALSARATRLGQEAATLRGLLDALEAIAPDRPGMKPARKAASIRVAAAAPPKLLARPATPAPPAKVAKLTAGNLLKPVSGPRSVGFGDRIAGGGKAEWIAFATRAEAQVTAPAAGEVEYAKPFRSYGSMLILRTDENYRVILMGMSRIYVTEGQMVAAGEPVGRMPDRADPAPELTLELRLGDKVLDPSQWLGPEG